MNAGDGPAGSGAAPESIVVAVERGKSPCEHAYDLQHARLVATHPKMPKIGFPAIVRPWADPPQARRCPLCSIAVQLTRPKPATGRGKW